MKKKVLIVRSVSFQQLDRNIERIAEYFRGEIPGDGCEFHILTHDHGMEQAKGYTVIDEIIGYGRRGNFTPFHLPGILKQRKKPVYHAVVVPVTNKSGAGFLNAAMMALRIRPVSVYMCNLTSDIWKISKKKIVYWAFRWFVQFVFSGAAAVFLSIVVIPFLLFPGVLLLSSISSSMKDKV